MSIENLKEEKAKDKKNVLVSTLKILLLVVIVVGLPVYIYIFHGEWLSQFKSFDDIIAYLQSYKVESIPIYIGIQVVQIVISVIRASSSTWRPVICILSFRRSCFH